MKAFVTYLACYLVVVVGACLLDRVESRFRDYAPAVKKLANIGDYVIDQWTIIELDGSPAGIKSIPKGATITEIEVVGNRVKKLTFVTGK